MDSRPRPARKLHPAITLILFAFVAISVVLIRACLETPAHAQTPATDVWMPPMLPTAPPVEFVSAIKTTGMSIRVDQQGWYLRTNIDANFRGKTPIPMAGQHVWRPHDQVFPSLNSGNVGVTIFVVDPLTPIVCATLGCTTPPSYAGFGIDGVTIALGSKSVSTAPGGGGNIATTLRKNQLRDFTITRVPSGYSIPTMLRWRSVSITDRDIWMLIELTKTP